MLSESRKLRYVRTLLGTKALHAGIDEARLSLRSEESGIDMIDMIGNTLVLLVGAGIGAVIEGAACILAPSDLDGGVSSGRDSLIAIDAPDWIL
jgi:hypothetical protein